MVGKAKQRFAIFYGDKTGEIEVYEDEIVLKTNKQIKIRKNYIGSLENKGKIALSRVAASLSYYDIFANKETMDFAMRENDFLALKKILGK